jgi:hypothetical protein
VSRPGMGIAGQLRRPLHHLLRHVAVVARQRPPPRLLPWLHAHRPFAAKANSPPQPNERQDRRGSWPAVATVANLTLCDRTVRENTRRPASIWSATWSRTWSFVAHPNGLLCGSLGTGLARASRRRCGCTVRQAIRSWQAVSSAPAGAGVCRYRPEVWLAA